MHSCAVLRASSPANSQGRDGWIGGEVAGLAMVSPEYGAPRGPWIVTRALRQRSGFLFLASLVGTCSMQGAAVCSAPC